ncbi:N-acetylmuramoyl-L-alanine amidase [Roseovarius sp. LXJ103]|uniref:N-acetylmuramoyl-L-alanine amidase n=1 Tax=Roseovarius carneus TaxID=2853164 RepID=UPI000D61EFCD|nr:N-acetylmuramoyl-L-alanine amidase [Roseovarius carneus]MBZ8119688.1 N-acetylmuramoyl-L-alanine amidase [Roseovarius carneus]PWE34699.1 N-acetylmuramoyl-L-alanine amidase [Pelagicola sp. LXJ1103]
MADPAQRAVICQPSPNFGARRGGVLPDILVIHYTNMQTAEAALARLCDPDAAVSCHYLIAEDGRLWQLVPEAERAWHAGLGCWGAVDEINSRSIGIELANRGTHPFPEPQMHVLEELVRGIMARWSIPPERVIGHSDMAPDRKNDPGPRFDWRRLALRGLAVWPNAVDPAPTEAFRTLCARVGYGTAFTDEDLLRAVRLRFRPWGQGPLVPADMAVLADIAARFPVDRPAPPA